MVFVTLNIGLFAALSAITAGHFPAGVGFGLFGLLSLVRLRSAAFSIKDVAYTFSALVLALVNGLPERHVVLVVRAERARPGRCLAGRRLEDPGPDAGPAPDAGPGTGPSRRRARGGAPADSATSRIAVVVEHVDYVRETTVVAVRHEVEEGWATWPARSRRDTAGACRCRGGTRCLTCPASRACRGSACRRSSPRPPRPTRVDRKYVVTVRRSRHAFLQDPPGLVAGADHRRTAHHDLPQHVLRHHGPGHLPGPHPGTSSTVEGTQPPVRRGRPVPARAEGARRERGDPQVLPPQHAARLRPGRPATPRRSSRDEARGHGFAPRVPLAPAMEVAYDRATLADPGTGSRVTIDLGVRGIRGDHAVEVDPGHAGRRDQGGPRRRCRRPAPHPAGRAAGLLQQVRRLGVPDATPASPTTTYAAWSAASYTSPAFPTRPSGEPHERQPSPSAVRARATRRPRRRFVVVAVLAVVAIVVGLLGPTAWAKVTGPGSSPRPRPRTGSPPTRRRRCSRRTEVAATATDVAAQRAQAARHDRAWVAAHGTTADDKAFVAWLERDFPAPPARSALGDVVRGRAREAPHTAPGSRPRRGWSPTARRTSGSSTPTTRRRC